VNRQRRARDKPLGWDLEAEELEMTRQIAALVALAVVVLGGIFIVAPKAAVTPNQASMVDIPALTKAAKNLPEQQYPAH
jgi:hypothetical protein